MFAMYSSLISKVIVPMSLPQADTNVSTYYSISFKKAIKRSRQSAVQVVSLDPIGERVSMFSGTYFKTTGSYFVITVMHGIIGDCDSIKVIYQSEIHSCVKYITIDDDVDYAIIQVEKIDSRIPIRIPRDLPKTRQWKESYSLLNKLVYTGYPNTVGPLTISGDVAGFIGTDYLYMLSYAWQGSSGSGVFDENGKYIGYVVAIDIGQTEHGIQILQNVVLVVPAFKIDWIKAITESE
jgi:S1-C subfamily serine protease